MRKGIMKMIRKASPAELKRIMDIYASAQDFMIKSGNPTQWAKSYPTTEMISEDISRGRFYVDETDGQIHGCFMFEITEDPSYSRIEDGEWLSDEPYGVIHRVAGDGTHGLMSRVVPFCEGIIGHLRIDTHENNSVMRRQILKNGFSRRGIVYMEDGSPRIAFEKLPED